MYNFFTNISATSVWIVSGIELLLLIYGIYKSIKTKSLFVILVTIITFGLLYDAFITSLGTITSASNMIVLSKIRFILHGVLVPLLLIISTLVIKLKKAINIALYISTGIFIILGLISAFLSKYIVIDLANISRLTIDKELTNKFINTIPTILNIVSIIPLLILGIIVVIKEKNPYLLLSSGLMFLFSAIGPILGLSDFIFLLSMFGEICLVLFALLYCNKKTN